MWQLFQPIKLNYTIIRMMLLWYMYDEFVHAHSKAPYKSRWPCQNKTCTCIALLWSVSALQLQNSQLLEFVNLHCICTSCCIASRRVSESKHWPCRPTLWTSLLTITRSMMEKVVMGLGRFQKCKSRDSIRHSETTPLNAIMENVS